MTLGSLKTAKELANALAYRRILKDLGDDPLALMPDDIPFGPQKGSEMGTGTWGWSGWDLLCRLLNKFSRNNRA